MYSLLVMEITFRDYIFYLLFQIFICIYCIPSSGHKHILMLKAFHRFFSNLVTKQCKPHWRMTVSFHTPHGITCTAHYLAATSTSFTFLLVGPWAASFLQLRLLRNQTSHIEAETKWVPFSRWHFQLHFRELKCVNFDEDFTEVCS